MKLEMDGIKKYRRAMIISLGLVIAGAIGFGLGRSTAAMPAPPEIKIEEAFLPLNNTPILPLPQSDPSPPPPAPGNLDCAGKIKGNIGTGGTRIYHLPGGSFYNRTAPEICFDTETEAQAAGFRKSSK